jgi:transcriptional regulator NrdR family protein
MGTHPAFTCPTCNESSGRPVVLGVVATRHPSRGLTRRYRECPRCGYPLVTVERAEVVTAGGVDARHAAVG